MHLNDTTMRRRWLQAQKIDKHARHVAKTILEIAASTPTVIADAASGIDLAPHDRYMVVGTELARAALADAVEDGNTPLQIAYAEARALLGDGWAP